MFNSPEVHHLRCLEDSSLYTRSLRQIAECPKIFRQSGTTETNSGLEEAGLDARIKSYRPSHFLDICGETFAEVCEHVGIGNLHGKKGICGVLDHFCAANAGYEELWRFARRTSRRMDWAAESLTRDGSVNLAENTREC